MNGSPIACHNPQSACDAWTEYTTRAIWTSEEICNLPKCRMFPRDASNLSVLYRLRKRHPEPGELRAYGQANDTGCMTWKCSAGRPGERTGCRGIEAQGRVAARWRQLPGVVGCPMCNLEATGTWAVTPRVPVPLTYIARGLNQTLVEVGTGVMEGCRPLAAGRQSRRAALGRPGPLACQNQHRVQSPLYPRPPLA